MHPTRRSTAATTYYRSVADLPRRPTRPSSPCPITKRPRVAGALAARGAGGFVCFSAGFSETGTRVTGSALTRELSTTPATLPFFGPNCYGFVNFFDRAAMMPDQIVGRAVERGVALICQSGTIALTLMFNQRSLPIGYLFTVGNQTRSGGRGSDRDSLRRRRVSPRSACISRASRIPSASRARADKARRAGKPIAVIKSGRTAAAARTAHSHTGALAGADDVFDAFCRQAGIARCDTLGHAVRDPEAVSHAADRSRGRKVLIMGASGGDMAMTADVSRDLDLDFAPFAAGAAPPLCASCSPTASPSPIPSISTPTCGSTRPR